jgi:hypothetical protein
VRSLTERPRTKEELIEALRGAYKDAEREPRPEALRKKCERYLKEFEELGLVTMRIVDGKKVYCWYVYQPVCENPEFLKNHAKDLIPAFMEIANMSNYQYPLKTRRRYLSEEDMALLWRSAMTHLVAIPGLWELYEDLSESEEEAEEKHSHVIGDIKGRLEKEFGDLVVSGESQLPRYVRDNIPYLIYDAICDAIFEELPRQPPELVNDEILWRGTVIGRGSDLLSKVGEFIRREVEEAFNTERAKEIKEIEERFENAYKLHKAFQEEIRKLLFAIEAGATLAPVCEICKLGSAR